MRNYQTDGGSIVNFLTEIDNIDLNDDENICLISNQPLDETHVALNADTSLIIILFIMI